MEATIPSPENQPPIQPTSSSLSSKQTSFKSLSSIEVLVVTLAIGSVTVYQPLEKMAQTLNGRAAVLTRVVGKYVALTTPTIVAFLVSSAIKHVWQQTTPRVNQIMKPLYQEIGSLYQMAPRTTTFFASLAVIGLAIDLLDRVTGLCCNIILPRVLPQIRTRNTLVKFFKPLELDETRNITSEPIQLGKHLVRLVYWHEGAQLNNPAIQKTITLNTLYLVPVGSRLGLEPLQETLISELRKLDIDKVNTLAEGNLIELKTATEMESVFEVTQQKVEQY